MVRIASLGKARQRQKVATIFVDFHIRLKGKSKNWKGKLTRLKSKDKR